MNKIRFLPYACLMGLVGCFGGCSSLHCKLSNLVENSPASIIGNNALQAANDPEMIKFYQNFFPGGKPELSYRLDKKQTQTKFIFRAKGDLKENFNYTFFAGIEIKY